MIAFYFTGIVDFQDMFSSLIEVIKRGYNVWVCIFDCLNKKRQFYYYEKDELINLIKDTLEKNKLAVPNIDFFGQNDKDKFESSFLEKKPKIAFIQGIWHKYPKWIPLAPDKIVHFTWSYDTIQTFHNSPYKKNIILSIARYKIDEKMLSDKNVKNCLYFGNTRMSQLKYNTCENTNHLIEKIKDKKVCFIPERWFRKEENATKLKNDIQEIIIFLKKEGYTVVWKKREKGYPFNESHTILSRLDDYAKPDIIIDKDLHFPGSMITMFKHSHLILFLGITTSLVDSAYIKDSKNIIVYDSDPTHVYNKLAMNTLEKEKTGYVTIITKGIDEIKNSIRKISDNSNIKNKDYIIEKEVNAEVRIVDYLIKNKLI